jgi:hypothetical protein
LSLFNCAIFNARSLNNKLVDLHAYLNISEVDILCITETWLKPTTPDSLLINGLNYTVFRSDRITESRGGGVCILINNVKVSAIPVCIPRKYSHVEVVAIDLLHCSTKVRLFVCYRAPASDNDLAAKSYIVDLCSCIETLMPHDSTVVICGDFNLPSIDWNAIDPGFCANDTCVGTFLKFYFKHALSQLVLHPTRTTMSSSSTLDLILCNDNNFVLNPRVDTPFSSSDHSIVYFNVIHRFCNTTCDAVSYNFDRADWHGIYNYLNGIDFKYVFNQCDDINNITSEFYAIIRDCFANHVPAITKSSISWFHKYPAHIRRKLKRKSIAWRVFKRFHTSDSFVRYKSLASQCRSLIYQHVLNHENNIINSGNTNKFYRYANKKFCVKSAVGPLKNASGVITTEPKAKADLLSNVFSACFSVDNHCSPSLPRFAPGNTSLSNIVFSPGLVHKSIKHLRAKSKGGPTYLFQTVLIVVV